jgi:crotonobetainyl-CoA:carnitine CoA-transferase CaiB-like acyl-CoA transferase
MCQTPKFWELFCERTGQLALKADPRFAGVKERRANLSVLTETLDALLTTKPTIDWLQLLGGHVPIAPVYDIAQALENPFVAEIGMTDAVDHPDAEGGRLRMLASPIKVNGKRPLGRRAPKLGEQG